MSETEVAEVLSRYPEGRRDSLIPILQEVQDAEGFLSREAIVQIGGHLDLPPSKIYGVATFYNQFRFQAKGKYHIQVCRGTACHVKGSAKLFETLKRELKIQAGETSRDGLFSLEVVACVGACGLAPVICVNGEFHAKMTTDRVKRLIRNYRKAEKEATGNGKEAFAD